MTLLLLISFTARLLPSFLIALCHQKAVDKLRNKANYLYLVVVFGQIELHEVTVVSVIRQCITSRPFIRAM